MRVFLKRFIQIFIIFCSFGLSFRVFAYEVATHADITDAAYDRSVLAKPDFINTLGISATDVFDKEHADPTPPKLNDGTARGWVR